MRADAVTGWLKEEHREKVVFCFLISLHISQSLISVPLSIYDSISLSRSLSPSLPELTPAGWVPVLLTNKSWQLLAGANINSWLPGKHNLWDCFNKADYLGLLIYLPRTSTLKAGRILSLFFFLNALSLISLRHSCFTCCNKKKEFGPLWVTVCSMVCGWTFFLYISSVLVTFDNRG